LKKQDIKLGYVPTRREVFSREEAGKFRKLIKKKLISIGIDLVDIDWLNDEGLLYDEGDVEKITKKFNDEGVDAVFSPHCNFGTESAVAKLAKIMKKPFLLWGPRDDFPLPDGNRTRDTQCGLFATSKILTRYGVPFSYIVNSSLDSLSFTKGIKNFLAVASIVKTFKNLKIGQISTRPGAFWSVMCNEAELLEKFGIEVVPITLSDIAKWTDYILNNKTTELNNYIENIKSRIEVREISEEKLKRLAALKIAMQNWAEDEGLSAISIQCWNALQDIMGIMPCFANAELTDMGIPVVCETDIHGAVTAVMLQASMMNKTPIFFADLTIRHPENDNGELLWHCGVFPYSLKTKDSYAKISKNFILPSHCPGIGEWEIKGGDITIARFDGLQGEYNLFMGHAKGIKGPKTRGTYLWIEVNDWPLWEEKLIRGPYIHHVAGIHGNVAPILYEACRYIHGLKPDPVDPTEEEIKKFLRG